MLDLVVIGGGPGGYVAALRAAQLGMKAAVVEREPQLGGTCLRIGCIPSKALLESSHLFHETKRSLGAHGIKTAGVELDLPAMQARKRRVVDTNAKGIEALFRKHGIQRVRGTGSIAARGRVRVTGDEPGELECRHILIATGSVPAGLPGVAIDGDRIGTSTEALAYDTVPTSLVVIGAGAIGLELGSVWSRLGAEVTVLEYLDRILPGTDAEIAGLTRSILERQGLRFQLGTRVESARVEGGACVVRVAGAAPIEAERVLLAVGRAPCTDGLGLEAVGIEKDGRGRIVVDRAFETTAGGIYAVGDVIAGPMLAHKAQEEGVACVEKLAGLAGHVDYDAIPSVVYTEPEVASVGKSSEELDGVPHRSGLFPFAANGRARALGSTEGRVKVIAHAETDRVLGVHIVGPRAGDLIAECAAAISFGASSEDIARTCHAHPTLSEAVKEAALAVDGRALHI